MFGLFKRKKEIKVSQLVWKNKTAKYKGMFNIIKGKQNLIFVYYFNSTKTELEAILENFPDNKSIKTEAADKLASSFTNLSDACICFMEHHPSFIKENTLLQHLLESCEVKEVFFYVSLDEALFQHFGSDNILQLMGKMGFGEDEYLEHSMILKSVVNAQKKLDEETGGNTMETATAKDWFELNVRKD